MLDLLSICCFDGTSLVYCSGNGLHDKATVMKLCVGARLNLDETKDLLERAGFALSPCDKRDVLFSYFIENEYYDLLEMDVELEARGLKCFLKS